MQLEVIAQDKTMIRKAGNVYVTTIASKVLNVEIVKRNIGKANLPLKLMRDTETGLCMLGVMLPKLKKTHLLEGVVGISRSGRILKVERKERK